MRLLLFLLPLLLLTGCVCIDYTGKKFPATDNVVFYKTRAEMPLDKYTIIGRFTVTARRKTNPYIAETEVLERAAKYGGDAVCLVHKKVEKIGTYNTNEHEFGTSIAGNKVRPDNEKQFGHQLPLTGSNQTTKRLFYQFLLLKETDKINFENVR